MARDVDRPGVYHNLQALRAFAAYGVVWHHITSTMKDYLGAAEFATLPSFGRMGAFFVISGFLMMHTTSGRQLPMHAFLRQRIVRIVPLYWLLTLLAAATVLSGFDLFNQHAVNARDVLSSLAFFPEIEADGAAKAPLVYVGWTLNYEMMFYLLFGLCLCLHARWRAFALCAVIGTLWLSQELFDNALVDYWGADLALGFGAGVLLGAHRRFSQLPATAAWALTLIGVALVTAPDLFRDQVGQFQVLVVIGAALIVQGALALENAGVSANLRIVDRQGDASYALFLIHPFILQIVGKLAILGGLNQSTLGLCLTALVMFAASVVAGTLVHRWFELPLKGWITNAKFNLGPSSRGLSTPRA